MTLPDPPPQPPEPTRIPSTLGGLVYLGVCLVTAVGLLVVAFGPWRRGIALIGVALVIAAGMRSFLSEHDSGMLRVRSAPEISDPPQANVVAHLPDGHPVHALSGPRKGFFAIETSLKGALIRGFASAKFLVADAAGQTL